MDLFSEFVVTPTFLLVLNPTNFDVSSNSRFTLKLQLGKTSASIVYEVRFEFLQSGAPLKLRFNKYAKEESPKNDIKKFLANNLDMECYLEDFSRSLRDIRKISVYLPQLKRIL